MLTIPGPQDIPLACWYLGTPVTVPMLVVGMTAQQLIADWRAVIQPDAYFSSSRVQDRLFDLYAELGELPAGAVIERWLTLTIQRDLFSGAEILELLQELEAQLVRPVSAV